ncbi:Detected protein of confused Function [Hibiscus syriacus]|uniref:Detected protein of confused Function n=1 Tax=Hibiscus syriacus TaxID=106335 RepID=A0A6A3BYU8_HIBSY|nr:Detected protein of confused Function [Hibiscus syriacus]
MPLFFLTDTSASSSTMAERLKLRRPTRSETNPDPVSEIPSLIHSTRPKSTNNEISKKKGNPFSQSSLRGLGCAASASQQVSVPALIRSSADWEAKKVKKKKKKRSNKMHHHHQGVVLNEGGGYNMSCGVVQDVWCGPGIGLSADAVGSVDRVVARRNVPARGKIDLEKVNHREPSFKARRPVNPETLSSLDSGSAFFSSRPKPDFFGARYYRHARHPSPEGLAEMMVLQNNLIMGARDRFSDWRLDIDSMSYEHGIERRRDEQMPEKDEGVDYGNQVQHLPGGRRRRRRDGKAMLRTQFPHRMYKAVVDAQKYLPCL